MPYRCRIDRLLVVSYLGLMGAGCGGAPPLPPVMPVGGAPVAPADARAWVDSLRVQAPVTYKLKWLYRDRQQSAGGRGSARMVAGDSLRFDFAGPLGAGRGAAFVIGDSLQWVQGEEGLQKLVPSYPLLWAIMGLPRLPAFTEVTRVQDPTLVAWRFVKGSDTVEYARIVGPPMKLVVDVRRADGRLGRVETVFGPDGVPKSSRLTVPRGPARLDITYVSSSRPNGYPPEIWVRPPQ